ncbi:unnamed protein product, partial [Didymodactylos carnosus]
MATEKDQKNRVMTRKITFFGAWNVRSCFRQPKRQLIIQQLKQYKIQIGVLCETGMYDSGVSELADHTIIHSGLPSDEKTKRAHGMAVCLDQSAAKVWKASGSAWEAVSSRILTVRLGCKPINITVIAVYAPVNPANGQKSEVEASEDFYKCLQETIDKVQKQDMVLVMGDFNARLGQQQNLTAGEVVGRHTVVENLNGELLVDFCSINNMVVTNTFFEHKPVHQTSWMHPGTKE